MAQKIDDLPHPRAGLGLVRLAEGFARAGGDEAGAMPRGCPACNREEGRSSTSHALAVELPLEREGDLSGAGAKAMARLVVDYCPRCGRIYDVRCSARVTGNSP